MKEAIEKEMSDVQEELHDLGEAVCLSPVVVCLDSF